MIVIAAKWVNSVSSTKWNFLCGACDLLSRAARVVCADVMLAQRTSDEVHATDEEEVA